MSCVLDRIRGGAKRDGNVKRNERIRKDMVAVGECKQVDRLVDSGGGVGWGLRARRCLFESILIIKKRNNEICFIGGKKTAYGK